jgi:hypothetical protein
MGHYERLVCRPIIGKQKDTHYQPGKRSSAWIWYPLIMGKSLSLVAIFPDHTALTP